MGHDMHITDDEMALCRAHALKRRREKIETTSESIETILGQELR